MVNNKNGYPEIMLHEYKKKLLKFLVRVRVDVYYLLITNSLASAVLRNLGFTVLLPTETVSPKP